MSTGSPQAAMAPSDYLAATVRVELARRGLSLAKFAASLERDYQWTVRRLAQSRNVDLTLEEAAQIAEALGWDLVDLIHSPRPVLTSL